MNELSPFFKKRISPMQLFLTVLFVVCLLISNIIESKQIEVTSSLVLTGGLLTFPITYILSDLFSEVYGYRWSRITCYLAFAMNLLMVTVFSIVITMPSPDYATNAECFANVLGNTPRILFASSLAFILGDFVNDRVFQKFKSKYPDSHKGFKKRAIVSSFCGEVCDSIIFFPIAFLGEMPFMTLVIAGATQIFLKTFYEVLVLPLTSYLVHKISKYEKGRANV